MDRSIVNCGPGTIALCAIVVGRASVTPVPYSEMASSAYMAPEASDRVLYRYSNSVDWRAYNKAIGARNDRMDRVARQSAPIR
jgi:hypothetical protein